MPALQTLVAHVLFQGPARCRRSSKVRIAAGIFDRCILLLHFFRMSR
jgi:hypothetical protein